MKSLIPQKSKKYEIVSHREALEDNCHAPVVPPANASL